MAYLEEFLYRGRDPVNESGQQPDYHVVLAEWGPDIEGVMKPRRTRALTPTQAAALGFPLAKILSDITAGALLKADHAQAQITAVAAERDAALLALKDAQAQALQADEDTGPSNPVLHALTLGLAGK